MLERLPDPDGGPPAPLEAPLGGPAEAAARLRELMAENERLRRQAALEAQRLQAIRHELALAAAQGGDGPLAGVLHALVAIASEPLAAPAGAPGGESRCVLHDRAACPACGACAPAPPLSAREREVLRLLTEGCRSPCIAERLGICSATVEVHRRNIMRKLGLHSVAALTKYAVREGLTPL